MVEAENGRPTAGLAGKFNAKTQRRKDAGDLTMKGMKRNLKIEITNPEP